MSALSDTAQVRVIAKEVVENQQRVCAVQMKSINDKLDGVISDTSEMKTDMATVKTEVAVIKTRIAIGVAAILGFPMLVDFIRGWFATK